MQTNNTYPQTQTADNQHFSHLLNVKLTENQLVKDFLKLLKSLKNKESLVFEYKVKLYEKPQKFEITCYKKEGKDTSYTIHNHKQSVLFGQVNVSSMTSKYINCYTFDLFSNQSKTKLPISDLTIVKILNN